MTGFEVKGVEQRVDSAGWTTSLKGQMRVSMKSRYNQFEDREETFEIQGYNPFQAIPMPPASTLFESMALRRAPIPDLDNMPLVDVSNLSETDPPVVDKEVSDAVVKSALKQDEIIDNGGCGSECVVQMGTQSDSAESLLGKTVEFKGYTGSETNVALFDMYTTEQFSDADMMELSATFGGPSGDDFWDLMDTFAEALSDYEDNN